MSFATDSKRGVEVHYGARTTEGKFGAQTGEAVIKHVVYNINAADLSSTSPAAVTGLDYVYPPGSVFLSCHYLVDEAIVGPTAITCGTYLASDGTTAHDADGLMTAAVGVVTALDAVGDRVIGTGALLATGTGAAFSTATSTVVDAGGLVLRILPTVAAATAGKMLVYVSYIAPQP